MKDLVKKQNGEKEYWQWKGFQSKLYDFLEERPWTPMVIADELCFSAKENSKWKVVWGKYEYQNFDDVYDTDELKGKPVYIARNGDTYFIVNGYNISQGFDFQVTFKIENDLLKAYRFDKFIGRRNEIPLRWNKIKNR